MKISIRSEWDPLKTAIAHDGRNARNLRWKDWRKHVSPEALAAHPETGEVRKSRIIEQVAAFHEALRSAGVDLIEPKTKLLAPCQLFTRDPGFAVHDLFFLAGMRDTYRFPEVEGLQQIRRRLLKVFDLRGEGRIIEGGDVFVMDEGNVVLVGQGEITNEKGFQALKEILMHETNVLSVEKVPHGGLHLDCGVLFVPDGTAFVAEEKIPVESRKILRRHVRSLEPLDPEEARLHLASNVLYLNQEKAISSKGAPKTNARLKEHGVDVEERDLSELIHKWGGARCAVGPLLREESSPS